MKKYMGEEFLNKIYKDLHNSEIVMHTAQKSDNKNEKVERYLDRLESVTNRVFDINNKRRENDIEYLKKLYYKKYVIKEEDVPESYFILQEKIAKERGEGYLHYTESLKQQERETIIKEQEESIDKWIEYLASRDTEMYPTWFKYYAFQGMLKLGNYDKEKGEYNKRTKHTVKPFIEINREALAMVYDSLYNFLQKEEISDIELETLLQSGNFGKLYSYFVKVLDSISKDNTNSDEGIWKKYNGGSNPEILYNDIHGKGTGWCTAGGIETAKKHIEGGDFYVYYTKDKEGIYTCPRIAIRKENNKIAEIRGTAANQNIEPNMERVVEEKLKEEEFPDREEYKKKVKDMQMMTYIYTKHENNIELTKEDLRFLYEIDDEIKGFGYEKDSRINEIIKTRNIKKDLALIFECKENQISFTNDKALNGNIICHYGDLNFYNLKTVEGIILPKYISGDLSLDGLTSTEGLVLPKHIRGTLYLCSITNAKGLVLPEHIGGSLYLSGLINKEGLVLPKHIVRDLYLSSLTSAECLELPEYIGRDLDLGSLTNTLNLVLPKRIDGNLNLNSLTVAQGLIFSEYIGESLFLNSLTDAQDLILTGYIGGSLNLGNLTRAEGLILPKHIEENLFLNSITDTKNLILPEYIGKTLYLNNLSIYDKIILPKIVQGFIYFKDMKIYINGEVPKNEDGTLNLEAVLEKKKQK